MSSPNPHAHDRSDFQHGEEPSSMREKKGRMSKEEPSSAKGRAIHKAIKGPKKFGHMKGPDNLINFAKKHQ